MAASLVPPAHVIRPLCSPSFNAADLLNDAVVVLLEEGCLPDGWEFKPYVYSILRRLRSNLWREHVRRDGLVERYQSDWRSRYALA